MIRTYKTGTAVNFALVTHAWTTDQPNEVVLYFVGGTSAQYLNDLADEIWKDLKEFHRREL